jgi:hypothetical protein
MRPRALLAMVGPIAMMAMVALAQRGLGRDFEAAYKVSGQLAIFPGPKWRVAVAHQGPAPRAQASDFRPVSTIGPSLELPPL